MSEVSLKEHIEAQIRWVDRYFESQIKSIAEKTLEAKGQIDKRLEGMNEFRDALRDTSALQATKDELRVAEKALDARLKLLELRDARLAGMAAAVALVVSIVIGIISRFL